MSVMLAADMVDASPGRQVVDGDRDLAIRSEPQNRFRRKQMLSTIEAVLPAENDLQMPTVFLVRYVLGASFLITVPASLRSFLRLLICTFLKPLAA